MTSADTRVNDLVVNVMTEEQFEKITPQDNQLYLVPSTDKEIKFMAPYIANMALSEYDTQEVVDARNFIYSLGDVMTIDLDLSNNTFLKRLVANGNINKLLKLNSVTVSPEAPFDNATSPQLNVSYTGLSRAALVNLFESMPYNVGYEVVGSPTIVDGVASGFSSNDYLKINNFSTSTPFEMVIRTKYNTFTSGTRYLFGFAGFYILQDSGASIYCSIQKSDETLVYPGFGPGLSPDTFYYLKFVYDGTTLWTGRSTDGTNYTETYNQPLTLYSRIGTATLGYRNSATTGWDGSIDLNQTYIKVNGVPCFTGKAAMTKTCSIVGCTGTAELTQEDKNIALDKGWELTVA